RLEESRLLRQRRVAIHLQELVLDLHHLPRARDAVALLGEHLVVGVEVVQVVRPDDAELLAQPPRQLGPGRDLLAVLGEEIGQDVVAVDDHGPHPRQVVEADVVDEHAAGLDAEQPGEVALEPDRDVAEPDGAVARVEQGARDDPDRVREVDDPRAGRRPVEHPSREPSDDVEPLRVDVVERELPHPEPLPLAREARHELRRVRRAGADDTDLHPFTPVSVTPSTNARCARKKSTITGAITSSVAAIVRFHCTWCSERNSERPIDSTQWWGLSVVYSRGRKKSLNVYRNEKSATAAIA